MQSNSPVPAWAGALVGLVSGAVALGVAQLVAGIVGPTTFPVVAVGDAAIDLTPAPVKDFAIRAFGSNDKAVLLGGVLVVLAALAALLGTLSRHRPAWGYAGFALIGLIGVAAVLTRPDATPLDVVPTLVGVVVGAWALRWLLRRGLDTSATTTAPRATAPHAAADAPHAGAPRADAPRADAPRSNAPQDAAAAPHADASGAAAGASGTAAPGAASPRDAVPQAAADAPHADASQAAAPGPRDAAPQDAARPAGDVPLGEAGLRGAAARTAPSDGSGASGQVAVPGASPQTEGGAGREAERPAVMRAGGEAPGFDRRRLLTGVAGGVVVAGVGVVLGRQLGGRQAVDAARVGVALPPPAVPAKAVPAGADLRIGGLSPFVTPNRDFYRVDTALVVPQVDPADWTLRIHGMVDRPIELTYADLLQLPLTEADVTLTCVSNEVGGPYVGNARWLGARMADVLRRAGLRADADMLLSTSADGFTCGTPVDVVMDGRDALFAVAMNGEALPVEHGFPVRQVVPGLYGYVSATKWVVDIKVTRFDRDEAYWTPRGWSAQGPIKTQSRIDVPKDGGSLKAGDTTIAGVAWAQHTGVDAVEVRVDGGQWRQARLAEVPGPDTWRQWAIDWAATPGEHTIEVRATDASGRTQTDRRAAPAPDGATGWHSVTISVA
ncbi:molybdopterin-dependent oxidoreductase [[Actinomadura] parvosata]|uniref:molybdopterin-dependent oxidoreductase n=1 Tax=[Actinomadura] parvosata TaxID=1955412 RepID=UPI00406CDE5F